MENTVSVEERLRIHAQLADVAQMLVKIFGTDEAARMLKNTARMISPPKPRGAK